ncbi:hypothetical protein [Alteromonas portus]|uniref:hypothetical protein n=1 Tax=Alteromonas portus TaxID=2565549 RepID=UPI003BF89E60
MILLLDELIVRVPEIEMMDYSNWSSAYLFENPLKKRFFVEKDFFTFSLEDSASQQASRVEFYLNEGSQLAVNLESSLVSRTVTP